MQSHLISNCSSSAVISKSSISASSDCCRSERHDSLLDVVLIVALILLKVWVCAVVTQFLTSDALLGGSSGSGPMSFSAKERQFPFCSAFFASKRAFSLDWQGMAPTIFWRFRPVPRFFFVTVKRDCNENHQTSYQYPYQQTSHRTSSTYESAKQYSKRPHLLKTF